MRLATRTDTRDGNHSRAAERKVILREINNDIVNRIIVTKKKVKLLDYKYNYTYYSTED